MVVSDEILVIGAGIGGLCVALALGPTGAHVTLLERDGPPPTGDVDEAFNDWRRRGVGHLRQSHAFLARLREIIRIDHPALHKALLDTGVRELSFEGILSPMQKARYVATAEDQRFTLLTSRRTTMELVIRRYVEGLANVSIRSNVFVKSLITEPGPSGTPVVRGLNLDVGGVETQSMAAIVVDAGGKSGALIDQLTQAGAAISDESETAGILYFTRHYRLNPGTNEPKRDGNPPFNGDLGYLKFGVFPGDNGCFSITICVPEIEYELRKSAVDPEQWEKMMQALPGMAVWTASGISSPTSKVFGMGDLFSHWRGLVTDGTPAVLGYFPLGDTLIRTNPLYGRGCSFAAVQAYILRDVLAQTSDPAARVIAYDKRVRAELHPYFKNMRDQDRSAIKRSEQILTPDYRPRLKARLAKRFIEDAVGPAMRYDIGLLREAMRAFHMFEDPGAWLKRPKNMMRILYYWARGRNRNAAAYPPKPGPDRAAMMQRLGLSAEADVILLAERRSSLELKQETA